MSSGCGTSLVHLSCLGSGRCNFLLLLLFLLLQPRLLFLMRMNAIERAMQCDGQQE